MKLGDKFQHQLAASQVGLLQSLGNLICERAAMAPLSLGKKKPAQFFLLSKKKDLSSHGNIDLPPVR